MDTGKTIKPLPAGGVTGASQASTRKPDGERLIAQMDRRLLRLGLAGLLDGGASK